MGRTLNVERDKVEVLGRLRLLRPDSPRTWGQMSPHQTVCHLIDSTRVALGDLTVTRFDTLFTRTVMKLVALRIPRPWPTGIRTSPEINQVRGCGTRPADYTADVARLESLTQRFAAEKSFAGRLHPIFGEMSAEDWLRWGYLHLDHHLRQFGV